MFWVMVKKRLTLNQRLKQEQDDLKDSFISSLRSVYQCHKCEKIFTNRPDVFKHFVNEHSLTEVEFKPKNPYDFNYIILSALVERYLHEYKEFPGRKYFRISNEELYVGLLYTLGFKNGDKDTPSNQAPHHSLKSLGLLEKKSKEKGRMGWNSKGNRVFHISITDLERVVMESEFYDLQLKLGQIDINKIVVQAVEKQPTSPSSGDDDSGETKTGESGGLNDDWTV